MTSAVLHHALETALSPASSLARSKFRSGSVHADQLRNPDVFSFPELSIQWKRHDSSCRQGTHSPDFRDNRRAKAGNRSGRPAGGRTRDLRAGGQMPPEPCRTQASWMSAQERGSVGRPPQRPRASGNDCRNSPLPPAAGGESRDEDKQKNRRALRAISGIRNVHDESLCPASVHPFTSPGRGLAQRAAGAVPVVAAHGACQPGAVGGAQASARPVHPP